ncbi:MAG TPA: hypothetical protein VEX18_14730 [Polyangiaceae bacterium]|nr:hypothetical protein [Polyangiaceae bacterium]
MRDTNRKARELVGDRRAVFVGMWAPWLMFERPYEFYTVRNYFNVTKPALRKLGVMVRRNARSQQGHPL